MMPADDKHSSISVLGVLLVPVHRNGHLHLLCSHALGGGGSAWDPVQQHTGCLVVGCSKCGPLVCSFSHFKTALGSRCTIDYKVWIMIHLPWTMEKR